MRAEEKAKFARVTLTAPAAMIGCTPADKECLVPVDEVIGRYKRAPRCGPCVVSKLYFLAQSVGVARMTGSTKRGPWESAAWAMRLLKTTTHGLRPRGAGVSEVLRTQRLADDACPCLKIVARVTLR